MKLAQALFLLPVLAFAYAGDDHGHDKSSLRRKLCDNGVPHDHDCDGVSDHDEDEHNASTGTQCFSKANTVQVVGKGLITMDSLAVGDYVHIGNEDFSRVISFAHLDHETKTEFLQIYSKSESLDGGSPMEPLELTSRHMLFVEGKPTPAGLVNVGDSLDNKVVTDVKVVQRAGVYAPITESGEIMVSGIRSSSYVALMDHVPYQHYLAHMFFSPLRALCRVNFDWCEGETYSADGFSNWSNWAIKLYAKANSLAAPGQYLLAGLFSLGMPVWCAAEQFLLAPLVALVTIGFVVQKYNATSKMIKATY